ncbi:polysaccharide biosynthesis/export family protein [Pontibaca sp. S1109L]|uniref:Polysaccharide biosynthesis/export family protein n=1 Tax=Pontibaca salina TaxID=2795731 RepID=A0A934LYK4_9RHOB|nr:polysaccharide biosynthesis/export family protein [Pontibaca salina]MBI6629862.1 polysaccharide biosynthesis/export family protein [Pontibaca salina]
MIFRQSRWVRPIALLATLSVLAACGLPQLGPNKRQIFAGSVQNSGNAFVIPVNDAVTRATAVMPALGFSGDFLNAAQLDSDTIRPGDVLGLTIWENVDDGLLSGPTGSSTMLEEVQVDGNGYVFVPYAGRVRAAGNSPEQLREAITRQLEQQTPDPQVEVRRMAGDGSTVSLVGSVGAQGVYPIERPTRTLATMLARAGGVDIEPEIAQITVTRGGRKGQVWFQDLFAHPELDIALRNGDRILVEEDTRAFTALGATTRQARVPFETRDLSALEAIAQVGGLVSISSDPTGVFVLREERAEVANAILGRNDLQGPQRIVYVLDLAEPNGLFMARDFLIRDGDSLYVTEAPYAQWAKSISIIFGAITPVASLDSLAGS